MKEDNGSLRSPKGRAEGPTNHISNFRIQVVLFNGGLVKVFI